MPTPAPAISVFALIPAEMFGIPIVGVIGIALWLVIMVLLFKSTILG